LRRLRSSAISNQYQTNTPLPRLLDRSDGTAAREGGYAQQSWMPLAGMLHLTAGVRWDHHSMDRVTAVSPVASASLALASGTRVQILPDGVVFTHSPTPNASRQGPNKDWYIWNCLRMRRLQSRGANRHEPTRWFHLVFSTFRNLGNAQ
jgi:hypothetical protein